MSDLGYTHIYEDVRQEFDISRDEYALCNYVQTWVSVPSNKTPGWCNRTQKQIGIWVGVTDRGLRKMIGRMVDLGLLEKSAKTGHLKVTMKWFERVQLRKRKEDDLEKNADSFAGMPGYGKETDAEQSSYTNPEQSSAPTGTKFRIEEEQSSASDRNKVPTHNEHYTDVLVISGKTEILPADAGTELNVLVIDGKTETVVIEEKPGRKKKEVPPREPKPTPVIHLMVQAFEEEHRRHFSPDGEWIGFAWGKNGDQGKEFAGLRGLKEKLTTSFFTKYQKQPTDAEILKSFVMFMQKAVEADKFVLDNWFTPCHLNSQYQPIIQKIYKKVTNANGSTNGSTSNKTAANQHDLVSHVMQNRRR